MLGLDLPSRLGGLERALRLIEKEAARKVQLRQQAGAAIEIVDGAGGGTMEHRQGRDAAPVGGGPAL